MNRSTKNMLRIISIILVLSMVLMELGVIPDLFNYKFWFMVAAYGLAIITFK